MFEKEAVGYRKAARKLRSAEELIKFASTEVYNRIGFIKRYNTKSFMRIYEVTLTQNLVYEILKFELETKIKFVDLYESTNESENGADLLLGLQVGSGFLKIPLQAKILTPSADEKDGSYNAFHHSNTNGEQSELLKEYARECGSHLPLYLLYNYTRQSPSIAAGEDEHLYGCSYLSADKIPEEVTQKSVIHFSDLHPAIGRPWHHMFRKPDDPGAGADDENDFPPEGFNDDPNDDVREFYRRFGKDVDDEFINTQLRFYTREELTAETEEWIPITRENFNPVEKQRNRKPFYKMVFLSQPMRLDDSNARYIDDSVGVDTEEEEEEFLLATPAY